MWSSFDTDGNSRSLRLLESFNEWTDQKMQLRAAGKGFVTNVRPLTVAEVLPPHLRSGSSPGEATSSSSFTPPVISNTEQIIGNRALHSVRRTSLQLNYTPIYRPGRYPYYSGMELASAERLSPQKLVYSDGYGAAPRVATTNLMNNFRDIIGSREAQLQSQQASVGISHGEVPAQEKLAGETRQPVSAQEQHHPVMLAEIGTAVKDFTMTEGEADSSSSALHGSSIYAWQADVGASHRQQATALTSTLVARMDALRQQLLRVSSTLSSVQERAAHLASSMGHRSQSLLYNGGGADPYGSMVLRHPVPGGPNASGATTLTAMADLPTQRYFPPAGYANSSEGGGRSPSPYGVGLSNSSDTRVYMVSVSAAPDLKEAASQLPHEPLAALQYASPSLSQHQQRSPPYESTVPQHIATSGHQGTPSAIAAAAAAFVRTYKSIPDPLVASPQAASPRPQRLSPAVAVPPGVLEEPTYHPFELGSPAGRTMHVSLMEPLRSAVGQDGSFSCASPGRPTDGMEGLSGVMSSPPNLRQINDKVGGYDEESKKCISGKDLYHIEGDDGHDGGERGMIHGGGGAALHSQGSGATSGNGARRYSPMPPTKLRPTAAAAVAAGVAPQTLASAFTRQFDSPILQELLMQSSQPRPPSLEEIGPRARDQEQLRYASRPGYDDMHQGGLTDSATVSPALAYAHHRRFSSGVYSNASSQDAERVYPWSGGDGGMSGDGAPQRPSPMSPSLPAHLRGSEGGGDGGNSAASSEVARTRSGRRLSLSGLSDVSSLDAARVHPWSGVKDVTASAVRLRSADGSLELMAVAPFASQGRLEADGETFCGGRERRTSISGRSIGNGSWLLLSPTVVVREVWGGCGVAVRTVEVVTNVAANPDAESPLPQSAAVSSSNFIAQEQERQQDEQDNIKQSQQQQQQGSRTNVATVNGNVPEDVHFDDAQGVEEKEEQEPSVAAKSPQALFDAYDGGGSSSGSTTPTPRADLSFAFHSASFRARDGSCDEDADGREWHQRGEDEDEGSDASRGERPSGQPVSLASVGSRNGSDNHAGGDDDEILQTPTHDSPWGPLKLRYPGATDAAATSDADSDASGVAGGGIGGVAIATAVRRRWQLQPRGGSSVTSASATGTVINTAEGLYDGYSEEEDEERHGGGSRRRQEMMRPADSAPVGALSSTIAQRAAAADLYHNFSFPFSSKESSERATTVAAVTSSSSTAQKAATLNNAAVGGNGGTGSAGSSTSGYGPVSPVVGITNNADSGPELMPETPNTASTSAVPHRLARPSRIVVPSSPRSSLGGWSLPSPVPSPYTYGVQGVRTPSSISHAGNFSLRKHLNLTVSSCLFADTSSEGDDYDVAESRLEGDYEPLPLRRQQQRADEESEVEEGEEVTSRPISWPRDTDGERIKDDEELGHHDNDGEEALEVEEEDFPIASDDDEATAAVAAWAYGDARQAAEAARGEGRGGNHNVEEAQNSQQ